MRRIRSYAKSATELRSSWANCPRLRSEADDGLRCGVGRMAHAGTVRCPAIRGWLRRIEQTPGFVTMDWQPDAAAASDPAGLAAEA